MRSEPERSRHALGHDLLIMSDPVTALAPAKINLNLHVLGRRSDGYHILDSIVVFSDFGDKLRLEPCKTLSLSVEGPTAAACGIIDDNLVLRAVRALQERRENIRIGAFTLTKNLPVAAGIGGGSSDAAAALRLLAKINDIDICDPMLIEAAQATGADVLVCLEPRLSRMRGAGEIVERIGEPFSAFAVLVNPRIAVSTPDVFRALGLHVGQAVASSPSNSALVTDAGLSEFLQTARNDLEEPALSIAPVIGEALSALRGLSECKLVRMSGSGATVFGLFDTPMDAAHASHTLKLLYPDWWVQSVVLS